MKLGMNPPTLPTGSSAATCSTRDRMRPAHHLILALSIALLTVVVLTGCGGGSETEPAPPPDYAQKLAGSPAPLAALHAQEGELLDGGKDAFEARMEELKGYPVVVNAWASWCGPCIAEFPYLQQLSAKLGKKVAFVGVNSYDSSDSASTLLRDFPVPYPSYSDPDREIYRSIGGTSGFPATALYDEEGNRTLITFGGYPNQEELEADIQTHAIEGEEG